MLVLYDRAFVPSAESVNDYIKIEGTLLAVSPGGRRNSGSVKIDLLNSHEVQYLGYKDYYRSIYRQWINKEIVGYYWPAHGFAKWMGKKGLLVFMAPEMEIQTYFHDRHFKNEHLISSNIFLILGLAFILYLPSLKPQLDKVQKRLDKADNKVL